MSNVHGNLFAQMGNTVQVSASSTAALADITDHPLPGGGSVMVANLGPNTAFFKFGDSSTVATIATGCPIMSGTQRVFSIGPRSTHASVICKATETADLYFTPGRGS